MSEAYREQLDRVRMMSEGNDTWDLSDNDISALKAVLAKIAELERQLAETKEDTARLDWAETHIDGADKSGYGADDMWWELIYNDGNREEGSSLRKAIDAARKEAKTL